MCVSIILYSGTNTKMTPRAELAGATIYRSKVRSQTNGSPRSVYSSVRWLQRRLISGMPLLCGHIFNSSAASFQIPQQSKEVKERPHLYGLVIDENHLKKKVSGSSQAALVYKSVLQINVHHIYDHQLQTNDGLFTGIKLAD